MLNSLRIIYLFSSKKRLFDERGNLRWLKRKIDILCPTDENVDGYTFISKLIELVTIHDNVVDWRHMLFIKWTILSKKKRKLLFQKCEIFIWDGKAKLSFQLIQNNSLISQHIPQNNSHETIPSLSLSLLPSLFIYSCYFFCARVVFCYVFFFYIFRFVMQISRADPILK